MMCKDSITKKCLDCMNGQRLEVKQCTCTDCPFYSVRNKELRHVGHKIPYKKLIKQFCKGCCEKPRDCGMESCPLYNHRI